MIGSIGVDMIEVARIENALRTHGDRFLNRVFTRSEREYCDGKPGRLAARFAAKEAVAKALGTGIGQVAWREIEVDRSSFGAPIVRLYGRALLRAAALKFDGIHLTLSHTHQHALAFVVCESLP